jgi:hypothetical protein
MIDPFTANIFSTGNVCQQLDASLGLGIGLGLNIQTENRTHRMRDILCDLSLHGGERVKV